MGKLVRSSFTLPPAFLADLDYVSGRLGVSRSALLAGICSEPLADVRGMLEDIPELQDVTGKVRFRGDSIAIVRMRMEQLEHLLDGDLVAPRKSHDS